MRHAEAAAQPDGFWRQRAARGSHGDMSAIFLARREGEAVGVVGGYRQRPADTVVQLVSMWVSPTDRPAGLGRRLVDSVTGWARSIGAEHVELWVTVGNEAGRRLYESCGFVEVGDYQPLPSDPCRSETRMRLSFGGAWGRLPASEGMSTWRGSNRTR